MVNGPLVPSEDGGTLRLFLCAGADSRPFGLGILIADYADVIRLVMRLVTRPELEALNAAVRLATDGAWQGFKLEHSGLRK